MDKAIAEASKVQIVHLNGNNYKHWRYRIETVCRAIPGADQILEGKMIKPGEPAVTADAAAKVKYENDLLQFIKIDCTILTLMTTNMTDELLEQVMRYKSAKEVWDELERLYSGSSEDKSYDLCLKFFDYNKDPEHDIRKHISALKNIWHELNSQIEANLPEILLICKILGTLPQDYFAFKSSWLLITKKDRTVENLTSQLSAYEKALTAKVETDNTENVLTVKTQKKKKNTVFKCNYCGEIGHVVRKCQKWINDGRPPKPSNASQNPNVNLTVLAIEDGLPMDKVNWYVDNGATSHVTNSGDFFESFEHFKGTNTVTAANGETIEAIGIGNIKAEAIVNGKVEQILLKDVWYVPKIRRNLFSVLSVHDNSITSTFESTPKQCVVKVNGEAKVIGTRTIKGGLFKLELKCVAPKNQEVNQLLKNPLQVYHERLVHQNKRHVRQVIEKELGLKMENKQSDICEGCIYGKAHRHSFGTRVRATKPGQLIHTDLCGPFPYSISKLRYYILFKDDFTRYRHIYFLRQKSEAALKLKIFLNEARTAGHVIKEMLSDNGGEFVSAEFKNILTENGIKQRFTMPHTPEQAGCVERENRTVVEAARSIMHAHTKIPDGLWAEIVNATVYVLNRTGPTSVPSKSPHELWYGQKPAIKHLRILGCTCYAHVPKANRKKLHKKAQKGILIGYEGDEGYRIWDKEALKLIRSRDVTFQEVPLLGKSKEDVPRSTEPTPVLQKNINHNFPSFESEHEMNVNREIGERRASEAEIEIISRPSSSRAHIETNEEMVDDMNEEDFESLPSEEENENIDEGNESDNSDGNVEREVNRSDNSDENVEREENRMVLRDRANLKPSVRFNDYIMALEANNLYEPQTHTQAISCKDKEKWIKAIESEINSLRDNETWELVELPKGRKAIPCKWIFKIKTNPDGSIDKYKARLVVKGYSQKKDIDFHETFSPVARSSTIRAILSVAAREKLKLSQFDVTTAFLYGTLDEEIYMKPPEGYADERYVFKLKKSLYGLKQAPLCWNRCITDYIVKTGFKQSNSDPCLFVRRQGKEKIILALYVDDGLLAYTSEKMANCFLNELRAHFKITVKPASYFLGMEIKRYSDGSILLHQKAYVTRLLERFGMDKCKPVTTPILKANNAQVEEEITKTFPYREAVGALSFLMTSTRPDIAYAISVASRNLEKPTKENILNVKRIMRYLKGTMDEGIRYRTDNVHSLECYSDADHGGDLETARSTSGILCIYAGGAISWYSKRQSTVAISSTEAEIVAASETARETIWLQKILQDLTGVHCPATLGIDNESAMRLAKKPTEFHQKTKHIRIRSFFVRECIQDGSMTICHVPATRQIADMLTKPLYGPRLEMLKKMAGIIIINRGGC